MTAAVEALRDFADRADSDAEQHRIAERRHRHMADGEAKAATECEANAKAYREAAKALATLHGAGVTLEGATCPSDCAARHPGREHEWITTHLPHNDDV